MTAELKISVVTACRNARPFLTDAMDSVLDQGYKNLEYVVIDGASSDGSAELVNQRSGDLAYFLSEPDEGLYDALNKGMSRTTGDIMCWLNADDKFFPWTFSVVDEIFRQFPDVAWISSLFPVSWDRRGRAVACLRLPALTSKTILRGEHIPGIGSWFSGFVQQESTFWRRSLWDEVGARVDDSLQLAGDFELWLRFAMKEEVVGIGTPLGGFRMRPGQLSSENWEGYLAEARGVMTRYGLRPPTRVEARLRWLANRVPLPRSYGGRVCKYDAVAERWVMVQDRNQ